MWKQVDLPLYHDIVQKPNKLPKMTKRQIKDISIQKRNCMRIPCALLFQITCLQSLAARKILFSNSGYKYQTFKLIGISSFTNFFKYFFCQGSQVL